MFVEPSCPKLRFVDKQDLIESGFEWEKENSWIVDYPDSEKNKLWLGGQSYEALKT